MDKSVNNCILYDNMEKNMNRKSVSGIQKDEKELVRLAQSGDFKAFNELIAKYRQKIYALSLKLAKNKQDAEDIFQETFLKAIDNIKQFRSEAAFGTWLYTIAVNAVRAKYTREEKKDLLHLEDYLPANNHGHEQKVELLDWKDPLSRLTESEVREKNNEAIAELPMKYRLPFLLRYTQDMTAQEVADTINLSLAATKSRILRARAALRSSLDGYFKEVDKNVGL